MKVILVVVVVVGDKFIEVITMDTKENMDVIIHIITSKTIIIEVIITEVIIDIFVEIEMGFAHTEEHAEQEIVEDLSILRIIIRINLFIHYFKRFMERRNFTRFYSYVTISQESVKLPDVNA